MRTLLLLLIACHSSTNPGDDSGVTDPIDENQQVCANTSGSRLRVRSYTTTDGTHEIVGWYDNVLAANCSFLRAPDGTTRCLPDLPYVRDTVYLDAACTNAAYKLTDTQCDPIPHYTLLSATAACSTPSIIAIGTPATFPATVYRKNGTSCVTSAAPTTTYYLPLGTVDSSMFVEGTRSHLESGTRLWRNVIVGSDGSRETCRGVGTFAPDADDVYDSARKETCRTRIGQDGKGHCMPILFASVGTSFRDSFCTAPTIDVATTYCGEALDPPGYVFKPGDQFGVDFGYGCFWFQGTRLFHLGDEVSTQFTQSSAGCAAVTPPNPDPYRHFGVGTETSPTEFVELGVANPTTGPRLLERYFKGGDGSLGQVRRSLDDTVLKMACTFQTATDGKLRCLPAYPTTVVQGFADAQCQTPLSYTLMLTTYGCTDTLERYVSLTETGCPAGHRIFHVGNPITTKVYVNDGTCHEFAQPNITPYTIGAEIPAAMFTEGTIEVE